MGQVTCADICGVEAGAARWERWPVEARAETGAAYWDWRAKVEVGEAPGAEDSLRGQDGEDADEDEAGGQNEGGGQHCCFHQRLIKLFLWVHNRRGEEGESK